ncbi:NAD-dependent epimerase/dehydratase family protein [Pontibacter sp. G13]|uniref:NAD-dependent epimerase/dehydratase family protein n=1 Tax=Pontibacter sp. G13 TaxID=3074898 RepID=UPI00288911D3|nr:NAD-dependent epimerase/dehydratase family protein [Pontibacter sp. G13]WNJ18900.1 NAD-dependent epimerase/dehydratase family protein [Pontibacter sp. G13]
MAKYTEKPMILLTGATGFLGRFIVDDLLASGFEVRLLIRNAANRMLPWGDLVEVVDGDVNDPLALEQAMEGVEAVIHAAAMVSFRKADQQQMMHVNVQGTAEVVNACIEVGVPKLVHVSSIAAVGRTTDGSLINEQTPMQNGQASSNYATSKILAEREIQRGVAEGLNAVMVNPGLILGPSDRWDQGTPKIFGTVAKGLAFYQSGENGLVGAVDVAKACRVLLHADVQPGSRYLLVGENWGYFKMLSTIAQKLGKKAPKYKIPRGVAITAGWLAETWAGLTGGDPIFTVENMRSGTHHYRYDGSKIEALGFEYVPMEQIIEDTAQKFLSQHSVGQA